MNNFKLNIAPAYYTPEYDREMGVYCSKCRS